MGELNWFFIVSLYKHMLKVIKFYVNEDACMYEE